MATLDRLGDMPALFKRLEDLLQPSVRPGPRYTPAIHSPALTDFAVVDVRHEMARTLGSWHRALFDALEWEPPALIHDPGQQVEAATKTLRTNLPWIASSWPAAGDFAGEIHELHRSAVSVARPRSRALRGGVCPAEGEGGARCGAVLRLPERGTVITCQWCSSTYPLEAWPSLRQAPAAVSPAAAPAGEEAHPSRRSATAGIR
ncbi:hypothetical protein [Streptomyces sp.]|uniref:hypothetical protein n=1 Tax=Streptomyces sp. TaxID=1931 RepID=UPI002F429675